MYMGVFPASHMCLVPQTPKEDVKSPGTSVTDSCKPPWQCWEENLWTSSQMLLHLSRLWHNCFKAQWMKTNKNTQTVVVGIFFGLSTPKS